MKSNKFAVVSVILSMVLIICTVGIPFSMVSATERDPYSYLVTSKLGSEWDALNSMNNAVDGNGDKIRTEEYVNIVEDPTNSGRGGVLKVGHANYETKLSLRISKPTSVNYSHKLETLMYIDGDIGSNSVILIRDRTLWDDSKPFDQKSIAINNMTKDKWVTVNTETVIAGTDGLSGQSFHHIHDGNITIVFDISLKAGDYLYIDDLQFAAGNNKTYKKNINTSKGDIVLYSNSFTVGMGNISKNPITHIDEWTSWVADESDSSFSESVGTVDGGEGTSVIFHNNNNNFTGSIIQNVLGLENGSYSLSVDYRSNGYSSAVISAAGYGGSKVQTAISDATDSFKTVTIENIQVTDNDMDVTIYADGKADEYLIIDNVTLKKDGTGDNLILNGDFESDYSATDNPIGKGSSPENWGAWLNGTDEKNQFIADEGYKSESSMAVIYPEKSSSNFNQTVLGLTGGKTYVVSAYVKFSGTGDVRLYLKNWGSNTNVKFPKTDTWVKIYTEVTLGQSANRISLEFYCNAKAGDWFMVDNVKVFEKQNPSVNLIKNGDFEKFVADDNTPVIDVEYKENIPNWNSWLSGSSESKFEESVGYNTKDNNTRLAFYNKNEAFIGSVVQDIPELVNGNYIITVKAHTKGYKSAVISATNYDKDNSKAKIQKTIASVNDELSEVSITVPVTNNALTVTVYADGLKGQYLIVDDVTVTAENASEQLALNGDFETKEPEENKAPKKLADIAYDWDTWANDGDVSGMFVADGGYNSISSYAMVNDHDQSNSLTQTFSNLSEGRYVFSAFLKSSGGQNDVAIIAKGHNKANAKSQAGTKMLLKTGVWTRVVVEFEVTSGNVSLSIWNNANSGNWIMIDNAKLYRKDDPKTQLLNNGGFDSFASYAVEFKLPPRAVLSGSDANQSVSSGKPSGGTVANNNLPAVNQTHSPLTGDTSRSVTPFAIVALLGVFSLALIMSKYLRKI